MKRLLFVLPVAALGCGLVQDFGGPPEETRPGSETPPGLAPADPDAGPALAPRWQWLNPTPTGNHLRGIWGTADDDIWIVGHRGVVVHWDGAKANVVREGSSNEELYAVWASSKNDVWIAGSEGGNGRTLHWDGETWSSAYLVGTEALHSLWGTSKDDVWALGEPGSVWRFDGHAWNHTWICNSCEDRSIQPVLRDLWGTSAHDVWVVGDGGALYHFDGSLWAPALKGAPGAGDPFARPRGYVGIWGSASNDVWAAFIDDMPGTSSMGFSHWDGSAWRVAQLEAGGAYEGGPEPRRRGHRLSGRAANDVLALVGAREWRFDGTSWHALPLGTAGGDGNPWQALWSSPTGAVVAVGNSGSFAKVAPSGATTPLVPGLRDALHGVSVAPDGATWAATGTPEHIVRWASDGWNDAPPLPAEHVASITAIQALSSKDVWVSAVGRDGDGRSPSQNYGFVTRYGEAGPGPATRLPMTEVFGLWVHDANDAWTTGSRGRVAHWDGSAWSKITWSGDGKAAGLHSVSGTSANDVWLAGPKVVAHWDGTSLTEVHHSDLITGNSIWASSPTDVWVGGRPSLHWDGKAWKALRGTDFAATSIWGSRADDVFFLSNTAGSGSIMHWDGTELSTALTVSPGLSAISGNSPSNAWVVGASGTTLRYSSSESGTR